MHRHAREDAYGYVLECRVGVLLGDQVLEAGPGNLIHRTAKRRSCIRSPFALLTSTRQSAASSTVCRL